MACVLGSAALFWPTPVPAQVPEGLPTSGRPQVAADWNGKRATMQLTAESVRFGQGPARSTFTSPLPPIEHRGATGEPRRLAAAAGTPIRSTSSTAVRQAGSSQDGLAWRTPGIQATDLAEAPDQFPVRQASAFQDPFGDSDESFAGEYQLNDPQGAAPKPAEPLPPQPAEEADDLPPPPPREAEPLPAAPDSGYQARSCHPAYNNDRDCCAELEVCRTARDLVRAATLDRISIDITPHFVPDEDDAVEELRRQTEQLGQSPWRIWRDKDGQELGRGRMTNYTRGRVQIVDSDGTGAELPFHRLHTEDLCFVTAWWSLPTECGLGLAQFEGRAWQPLTMTWKASALCNKPLYFEEVQLERYGHTAGPLVQPALSAAHFFVNIAVLPYKAGIHPPHECQYALGYYRPGNCAPWLLPPVPLSLRGAAAQAAAVGGLIAILPN
ncbi:MAG: hypothetical protein J5I93_04410 [Pirellulaceae bacterium]|nr:hypothetical protein [Pirellulaceae bacterium]